MKISKIYDFLNRRVIVDIAIMVFIPFLILLKQFLDSGLPAGTDSFGFVAQITYLSREFRWLYMWRPYGFGFIEHTNLLYFIFTPLNALFGDASFTIKFFVFASFVVAGLTMYAYVFYHTRRNNAALLAAIAYVLSQLLFIEFAEGHVDIMFSYALAPLLFLLLDRALDTGKVKNCLFLSLILLVFLTGFHPETMYIYGSFFPLYFLLFVIFPKKDILGRLQALKRLLKVLALSGSIAALLSSFFLLPLFLGIRAPYLAPTYGYSIEEAYGLSQIFVERVGYQILLIMIPLIIATMISYKNRYIVFFSISAFVAAFISKGPYRPFGEVFTWLYMNVPYMHVFRAAKRWFVVTIFSYAFLSGLFAAKFESMIKGLASRTPVKLPSLTKVFLSGSLIAVILANALSTIPQYSNVIQTYDMPYEYIGPYEWIGRDTEDFRVAAIGYFGYGSGYIGAQSASGGYHDLAFENYYIHDKVVLQSGGTDPLARDFFDFTAFSASWRRTDDLLKILGTLNVKYVVVPSYAPTDWYSIFANQQGAVKVLDYADTVVFQNAYYTPRIFASSKHALVLGGRNTILSLSKIPDFNLSNYDLIYLDQNTNSLKELLGNSDKFIFSESNTFDLAMLLLREYIIPVGQYAYLSIDAESHWVQSWVGRDFGKLTMGRNSLSTSGNNSINIPFSAKSDGEYELLLRVGFSTGRGNLRVYVDNNFIETITPTASFYAKIDWITLGEVNLKKGEHNIKLSNDGTGYNDVDAVAVVPSSLMQSKKEEATNLIQEFQGQIIIVYEAEDFFGQIPSLHLNGWNVFQYPYRASGGIVLQSTNAQNNSISAKIYIPKPSKYKLGIRIQTGPTMGILELEMEGFKTKISGSDLATSFKWFETESFNLDAGEQSLTIRSEGNACMDAFILYSIEDRENLYIENLFENDRSQQVTYQRINPTLYNIQVNSTKPFMLTFSDTYNPLWRAYINNHEIPHFVAYSFANGFYVNETGEINITLYFTGQMYADIGLRMSAVTLIAVIAIILLPTPIIKKLSKRLRKIK